MTTNLQVRFGPAVTRRVAELRKSDDAEDIRCADLAEEGLDKIASIWLERDRGKGL